MACSFHLWKFERGESLLLWTWPGAAETTMPGPKIAYPRFLSGTLNKLKSVCCGILAPIVPNSLRTGTLV